MGGFVSVGKTKQQALAFDMALAQMPDPWSKRKAMDAYHMYLLSHQRSSYGGSEMRDFDTAEAYVTLCIKLFNEMPKYILEQLSK